MELKYIDISVHQGKIDFKKIKEDGVQGVILRCGYTGYGTAKSKQKDSRFEEYYKGFTEIGLPIGVYWYSCAVTEEEATKEAKLTLEYIKDKKIELPVYIDTEDNHDTNKYSPTSQYSIGKTKLTKVIKAYCETIENAGYYVGIYASTSWFKNQLIDKDLKAYDHWVAQWASSRPSIEHGLWQYSSKGKVNGISGNVDMNKCYKDYPTIIKNAGLNGFTATKQESKPVTPTEPKKTVEELANEVIADKWGTNKTNPTRKERLTAAGYNYSEVQAKVNEILSKKEETITYTVQKGDYLVKIGKKFNVKWTDIAKLNNIKFPYIIKVGQVLKIK